MNEMTRDGGGTSSRRKSPRQSRRLRSISGVVAPCVLVLACVGQLGGCSTSAESGEPAASTASGDSTATSVSSAKRPITAAEASTLADVLQANKESKNAEVSLKYVTADRTVEMRGSVDWSANQGFFSLSSEPDGGPTSPTQLAYSNSSIFFHVPAMSDAFAKAGYPGTEWTVQQAATAPEVLVTLVKLIASSASEQRDNPIQLQGKGTQYVGSDSTGQVKLEGFQMGQSTLWIDPIERRLHRFVAKVGSGTVEIRFSGWGKASVTLPADERLIDAATAKQIFDGN